MSIVEVVPYNPEWNTWFDELRTQIWPHVSDVARDMIHVGSTSITGMSAKPIIDIDIVVQSTEVLPEIIARLGKLGYVHVGDLGITGREAFNLDGTPIYPHHLYVCPSGSDALRNHLLLKKHPSENPESFKRYNDLKIDLAKSVVSREEYWKSKTYLILEFLRAEGMNKKVLDEIKGQNL
jgi:GrpB-like predicted nucleotidyltransferase (UPF0157 family)